jgi:dihydrofolate reductase
MNLIAAADENWGIGLNNNLLHRIPEDMRRFRTMTKGKVVVMGRKTLESLPNSQCLKNRTNIILTKRNETDIYNGIILNSITQLLEYIKRFNENDVFIIGGQEIYGQTLEHSKTAYITKIKTKGVADKHFPNLDCLADWKLAEESEVKEHENLRYTFNKYIRR